MLLAHEPLLADSHTVFSSGCPSYRYGVRDNLVIGPVQSSKESLILEIASNDEVQISVSGVSEDIAFNIIRGCNLFRMLYHARIL